MPLNKAFPRIDYVNHPAFAPFQPAGHGELDTAIEKYFEEIDLNIHLANSMKASEIGLFFEKEINKKFQNILDLVLANVVMSDELASMLKGALSRTGQALQAEVIFWKDPRNQAQLKERAASGRHGSDDIRTRGFSARKLSSSAIDELNRMSKEIQEILLARRTGEMDCTAIMDLNGKFGKILLDSLTQTGVVADVSDYIGLDVELLYCGLQLSHQDDDWYKHCYSDVGLPTSKTVYMHLDESNTLLKSLIYLSEVSEENGPFRIVEGSHLWGASMSQLMFFKKLDHSWGTILNSEDLLSVPSHYYRTWMGCQKGREFFAKLPFSLRGTSHFGDDIVSGSELSEKLLADEVTFLSDQENCITFIGGKSVHRGSQVSNGYRVNLQLGWAIKPSLFKRLVRSSRRAIRTVIKGPYAEYVLNEK